MIGTPGEFAGVREIGRRESALESGLAGGEGG